MELLVVGGSGLLGRELIRQLRLAGEPVAATFHRRASEIAGVDWRPLDIRDRTAVSALVAELRPAGIINAAFQQSDWCVTADGGGHLAAAAAAAGARLVHVSSDAVFSGAAPRYHEGCHPDPITPYGAAKAAAETARTSLIIGAGDSSHERLVHALAAGAQTGVLFTDDIRCPVHVTDLASALLELVRSSYSGVHHVAGADAVSRYQLGVLIARRDGLDEAALTAGRRAETDLPGPIAVRLDCTSTQARLTTRLRGARTFLA